VIWEDSEARSCRELNNPGIILHVVIVSINDFYALHRMQPFFKIFSVSVIQENTKTILSQELNEATDHWLFRLIVIWSSDGFKALNHTQPVFKLLSPSVIQENSETRLS
jgi:hypothetical protein